MSEEDKQETPPSSVVMLPDFDMSEEELFLLQKTYDPRLYLPPDDPRLVQRQPTVVAPPKPLVEKPPDSPSCPFPVWRTIQLGTAKSMQELETAIETAGCWLDVGAHTISSKVTLTTTITEIVLVRVTVKELGFPEGATRELIYNQALSCGLILCPAEVGPQLRRQYLNQVNDESLHIAMETITNSAGYALIFRVENDRSLHLTGELGDFELLWGPNSTWIFAHPRPASPAHPIIDCDAAPWCPDGWTVEEHRKGGQLEFDPAKIALFLDDEQKNGYPIKGHKLRKKLVGKPVLNACVLDCLIARPDLIPEVWKQRDDHGNVCCICFWGTIYRGCDKSLYVHCLCWDGNYWIRPHLWLGNEWYNQYPAAVSAP